MNNQERELWVRNDEPLHGWFKSTRQSMTEFIKENKRWIDEYIKAALKGPPG